MLNMNMDHRTKDLLTDATAVLLKLVQKHGGDMDEKNMNIDGVRNNRHCHTRNDLISLSKVSANIEDIKVLM